MKNVMFTTHDFKVTAISRHIPEQSNPEIPMYFFAYWITITNKGKKSAKLLNRHWIITDADGRINEVNGKGVIGEQPFFQPGQSFEYNSFCPLPTEFGFMNGHYEMIDEKEHIFNIDIPQFCLSIPNSAN